MRRNWIQPLTICAALALPPVSGEAATITVTTHFDGLGNNAGSCTLREAIEAANTDAPVDGCPAGSGADEILLQPFTTYLLSLAGANENGNQTGDLDVTSSVSVRGNTLLGSFAYPSIDAQEIDRVFDVRTGGTLRLEKAKVIGGLATTNGGGIFSVGHLELRTAVVAGNATTLNGGGIFLNSGTAWIVDTLISGNEATFSGGGISQAGGHQGLVMERSELRGNDAGDNGGGLSGAKVRIAESLFVGNTAVDIGGGADLCATAEREVVNTTFTGNAAGLHGGGLYVCGDETLPPWLANLTITDNDADADGNDSGLGGGLAGFQFRLSHSIVAGNRAAGSDTVDCSLSGVVSAGHNLIGVRGANCDMAESPETTLSGTAVAPLDPVLGSLGNHGGPTRTHPLLAGSPAIDAGDPEGCPASAGLLYVDQRGFAPRYVDGDGDATGRCDIGAVEEGATDIYLFADSFEYGDACDWSERSGAPFC